MLHPLMRTSEGSRLFFVWLFLCKASDSPRCDRTVVSCSEDSRGSPLDNQ
jgi:hypothetical protein